MAHLDPCGSGAFRWCPRRGTITGRGISQAKDRRGQGLFRTERSLIMILVERLRRDRLTRAQPKPTGAGPIRPAAQREPPAFASPESAPRLRDWVGVLAMGTGLFLAIMDVQIVTSSLIQIQGG